jgi:hypothetical protein
MSFKYRDCCGGFAESMLTAQVFENLDALSTYLAGKVDDIFLGGKLETIYFEKATLDDRNGWDTYFVIGSLLNRSDRIVLGMVDKEVGVTSYPITLPKEEESVKIGDIKKILNDTLYVDNGRHARVGGMDSAADKIMKYLFTVIPVKEILEG